MAASREVEWLKSFSGGLYLTSQTSDLGKDFSPNCLNVDFGTKGGVVLRGGFHQQGRNPAANGASFICPFYSGVDAVLVQGGDGQLYLWNQVWPAASSGVLTDKLDAHVQGVPFHSELASSTYDRVYFANCWDDIYLKARYWDGTSLGSLGQQWNNDYLNPLTGSMPLARHIASHNGYLFVADTVEGGLRYPHRIRFSHQNFPESWAENDYIEVDPSDDGDPITGLVQFRDRLIIFKRSSVWALYGYNRDTFFLERITSASGIAYSVAADANSSILYWFSNDGRLMAYNGTDTTYLSEALQWWSDLGYIAHGGEHRVKWMDGRLWIDVEAGPGAGVVRGLFIWDPTVKAFTRYDKVLHSMIQWEKLGADADPLFFFENDEGVYRYDRIYSFDTDVEENQERIQGRFRTAWLDAGETATKKKWKRPQVTSSANADATLTIRVFHDFNDNQTRRTFTLDLTAPPGATLWGAPDATATVWEGPLSVPGDVEVYAGGNMVWGQSDWYYRDSDYYGFDRLGSAGSARAIQFEVSSDDNLGRWWLDSMALPFRRKQVK